MKKIYQDCIEKKSINRRSLAVLLDPDDISFSELPQLVAHAEESYVDLFLVGGSLMVSSNFDKTIHSIRKLTEIPIIIFPGNGDQICSAADGILLLSMISGRNPDLLIGKHVHAAPALKRSGLEIMPTGYMLIDGGAPTTVSYISNTFPIPADKPDIAKCTAMAGEMLGLQNIYMDAGSGAKAPIREEMIQAVAAEIRIPLWIGGGIQSPEQLYMAYTSGADVVVIGNAIERDLGLMKEFAAVPRHFESINRLS